MSFSAIQVFYQNSIILTSVRGKKFENLLLFSLKLTMKTKWKIKDISIATFFLTLVFFWTGCALSPAKSESQFVMGTVCSINLFHQGKPELYSQVFARLRELEGILSANLDGSDLDRINKSAGLKPEKVRPELIEVLGIALTYAEKSGGFFDPTVGPLVKLWGIGSDDEHIPGKEEIQKALDLINYREIEIDEKEGTVFLQRQGMALDLGAIAKGYAADEAARLLANEGVERAIIDLGGNIFAMGERKRSFAFNRASEEEAYWRIGVQDPREDRGLYIGILRVKNKSVVTSGSYERFFEEDGKRYHHIFSVESGFPVENDLLSVTITAEKSIDADALSTAAFALGWEGGRRLIAETSGAKGIFVFNDLSVRITGDLEKDFTLSAAEYTIRK